MINPRQLEIFMAVCDEKSMTAAAKKLYMTQPAVSQTIKDVEGQYNCELFERHGTKLYITEAGKVLYEYARRIMNLYRDLDNAISLNSGVREIRVGANISAGTAHLTELICRFSERYPDIAVKAMVFQAPVLFNALKNNELDIAL
ncbi:MAG: LysR family transcriptional regulator, partial [Lachnospiraceae bacterium]|nr:LysR family transcriptional regulator [Lachnospiraceae bacterium]